MEKQKEYPVFKSRDYDNACVKASSNHGNLIMLMAFSLKRKANVKGTTPNNCC